MSQSCSGGLDVGATRRNGAALRVADVLALAASPTFAVMALLTGIMDGGSSEMIGMVHASPMSGMVTMYLLMSAFHVTAWLKLMRVGVRDEAPRKLSVSPKAGQASEAPRPARQ
jgi:hypothetical protein